MLANLLLSSSPCGEKEGLTRGKNLISTARNRMPNGPFFVPNPNKKSYADIVRSPPVIKRPVFTRLTYSDYYNLNFGAPYSTRKANLRNQVSAPNCVSNPMRVLCWAIKKPSISLGCF
jgi:hypothetical protein